MRSPLAVVREHPEPDETSSPGGRALAIHTRGLCKRYGKTVALKDLNLTIAPAEVYGYLGPNGAGKTTTIRLLLGLHRPSAGRAELFGTRRLEGARASHTAASPTSPASRSCGRA